MTTTSTHVLHMYLEKTETTIDSMLSNNNVYFRLILSPSAFQKRKHANMKIHLSKSLVTTTYFYAITIQMICFRCYRSFPCSWGSSWGAAENPKISLANVSMLISGGSTLSNWDSVGDRHSNQDWYRNSLWNFWTNIPWLGLKKVMIIQCRWTKYDIYKDKLMHIYVNTRKPICNQVLFPGACFVCLPNKTGLF